MRPSESYAAENIGGTPVLLFLPECSRIAVSRLEGLEAAVINLDWTDFDADDHTMLMASVQTSHGRSRPLMWKTVKKSKLRGRRNGYEDELLTRLRATVPSSMKVTIVTDFFDLMP